jgi:hypothetical protein
LRHKRYAFCTPNWNNQTCVFFCFFCIAQFQKAMSELYMGVRRGPDMGGVKRELVMSDVGSSAAATKKVKRETVLQQLHRQAEQLRTWKNSDGENMLPAPLIDQSAQASELLLRIKNNQPSKWKETAQGYANLVTNVSTKIKPTWLWSLSTLPAPHDASGYTRVDSKRGVFIPRGGQTNHRRLGDNHNRFEAALVADEAKGVQIVRELDAGQLRWDDTRFWGSRQLNFNPNKENFLANVSNDHVLTTGQAASRGLLLRHYQATFRSCCAPLPPTRQHSKARPNTDTFRSHHLSEYSTIHVSTPPLRSATTLRPVHNNNRGSPNCQVGGGAQGVRRGQGSGKGSGKEGVQGSGQGSGQASQGSGQGSGQAGQGSGQGSGHVEYEHREWRRDMLR